MGLCQSHDEHALLWTLYVGERSVSYSPFCPTKGLEPLNELLWTLTGDLGDCQALDLLDSVEPGCRAY